MKRLPAIALLAAGSALMAQGAKTAAPPAEQ